MEKLNHNALKIHRFGFRMPACPADRKFENKTYWFGVGSQKIPPELPGQGGKEKQLTRKIQWNFSPAGRRIVKY